mmetsp:Transcript_26745/g.47380  ORF Transcript_26745/g.47380 Transcript_26745/m.47380 type:complete len:223 (+) Transcript_26745:62-730(+)
MYVYYAYIICHTGSYMLCCNNITYSLEILSAVKRISSFYSGDWVNAVSDRAQEFLLVFTNVGISPVGIFDVDISQYRVSADISLVYNCILKVGLLQIRRLKVGAFQLRVCEVSPKQIRVEEARSREVRLTKIHLPDDALLEADAGEVPAAEVRIVEDHAASRDAALSRDGLLSSRRCGAHRDLRVASLVRIRLKCQGAQTHYNHPQGATSATVGCFLESNVF